MAGKTWLETKSGSLVDEIPASYKDIDQVMADQEDLVRVEHTLTQVEQEPHGRRNEPPPCARQQVGQSPRLVCWRAPAEVVQDL